MSVGLPFDGRLVLLRRATVAMAAVAASFFTMWFGLHPLGVGVTPAILAAVLTITLSRSQAGPSQAGPRDQASARRPASVTSRNPDPSSSSPAAVPGSRARPLRSHHGGALRLAVIPLIAIAATGVAWLFENAFVAGALLFILGLSAAIWARRFGPVATRLGTLLSLPLVAVLIVPVRLPSSLPAGLGVVLSVAAAVVAVFWVELLQWLARVTTFLPRDDIEAAARADDRADGLTQPATPVLTSASPATRAGGETTSRRRLPPSTRMAAQLAVALAAAFVVGRLVFPDHWAWVVLTAFIVCAGNRGRGDVVYKSILRVAGAIAGTVAAVALTESLTVTGTDLGQADGTLVTVAVFVILFFGLWLRDVNYAFWAAAVTVILTLLGGTTAAPGASSLLAGPMLGERVVAIVVGALCGILASWFVLPVRTEAVVRRRLADALAALSTAVHPNSEPAARVSAQHVFEAELARLEPVARTVRAQHRVSRRFRRRSGRLDAEAHQAQLIDAVLSLVPLLDEFLAGMSGTAQVAGPQGIAQAKIDQAGSAASAPFDRTLLGQLTRAVGVARRSLSATPRLSAEGVALPIGTTAALAAVDDVRALLLDGMNRLRSSYGCARVHGSDTRTNP